MYSAITKVYRREGLVGLYKGNGAQLFRIFPYSAIQFSSYEIFKKVGDDWDFAGIGILGNPAHIARSSHT